MRAKAPAIEIYPMVNISDSGSTIMEGRGDPDFYDVIVRYEGDDPLDEAEDILSFEEAMLVAEEFRKKYPGADIVEIET